VDFYSPPHDLYQIDHRSISERGEVGLTPIVDQRERANFRGGHQIVVQALSDAMEAAGFKPQQREALDLLGSLSRSAWSQRGINEAKQRLAIARPGTAADAALKDAAALADAYAGVMKDARTRIARRFATETAIRLRGQHGALKTADSVATWCNEAGIKVRGATADAATMADADLNQAGGLVENLTAYLYMAFLEPQAPVHYREVFRIRGGIGLGLMYLQILFYTIRGEARAWEGQSGDYRNSGPGVTQLKLPVVHFRSSDVRDIITEAREQLVFGAAGIRQMNLIRAHEVLHNRMAFGVSRQSPPALPAQGLATYPGLTIRSGGYNLATSSPLAIFNEMVAAMEEPKVNSNQAFAPDTLEITPRIRQALKQPMVIGGVAVADSIESFFLKSYPGVQLRDAWELSGLLGTGVEAMFAYPSNSDASPIYLMNEPLTLPQWTNGYAVEMNAYSTAAGVLIPSPIGAELRTIDQT